MFYFVFEGNFQVQAPVGLIFGGAYTWRGLFSEFYGILRDFSEVACVTGASSRAPVLYFLAPTASDVRGDLITYVALETFCIRFCRETGNLEKDLRSGVSSFTLPGFKIFTKAFVVYYCYVVCSSSGRKLHCTESLSVSSVICAPLGRVSVDSVSPDLSTDLINRVSANLSIEYRPIVSTDTRPLGSQITQDPPFLPFKREGPTRHRQGILHNANAERERRRMTLKFSV